MFIHQEPLMGTSGRETVNFLWNDPERRIYVMDNHLAALWCWLRELRPEHEYSLVHVDYHWDDAPGFAGSFRSALSFKDFIAQRALGCSAAMYDNYIEPLQQLRPLAKSAILIAHQDPEPDRCLGFADDEYRYQGIDGLQWLDHCEHFAGKVLVNLDLDFFFCENECVFTPDFIESTVARLASNFPHAVWTIAWSPECCGGWRNAARVSDLVCEKLQISFRADQLGILPT